MRPNSFNNFCKNGVKSFLTGRFRYLKTPAKRDCSEGAGNPETPCGYFPTIGRENDCRDWVNGRLYGSECGERRDRKNSRHLLFLKEPPRGGQE